MTVSENTWAFGLKASESGEALQIDVLNVIGERIGGPSAVTAKAVLSALDAAKNAKTISVRLNSAGGEIMEGLAIYNALGAHSAKVEVSVIGVAASMASVIAMAGDTIDMAPEAFMMIHNPWNIAVGDGEALRKQADVLDKLRDTLASIYAKRTGRAEADVLAMMDAETWMRGDEAVKAKFADRVVAPKKTEKAAAVAYAAIKDFSRVPEELRLAAIAHDTAPAPAIAALPESPPPADGPAAKQSQPIPEVSHMADDKKTPDTINVISILRALELPAGATEGDGVNAAIRLRQLEVAVQALTNTSSTAEGLGALRAMAESAEKYQAAAAELVAVKAERDAQNIDALLAQGRAESKLSPAEEKFERDQFAIAAKEGRGCDAVNRLRGYLAVKAPDVRFARNLRQPEGGASASTPLVWNGKAYADLKPVQRAQLAQQDPDLFRAMKNDHDQAGAAA